MWNSAKQARLDQLGAELEQLIVKDHNKTMRDSDWKRLEAVNSEVENLVIERNTYKSALKYAGSASPAEWGLSDANPGDFDNAHYGRWLPGMSLKTFGAPQAPVVAPTSPMQLDGHQLEALRQAAVNKAPFSVTVGSKGFEHTMRSKSPLTEGGLVTNPLPVTQLGGELGHLGLPYETFRVLSALPSVQMDSPGIAFLRHNSNVAPAAYVAEAGLKPSIQPQVEEIYIRASKCAATVEATREILTDHSAFANFLPMELTRAVINAESDLLLHATHSSQGFDGLLNTSGIGAITIGASETPLDAIQRGIVSLRTGAAFAKADVAICSPTTLGNLRTQKDDNHRYLLDLISSAGGINATSEDESLWGIPVRQTTQIADDLVVLLSTQAGGGLVYIREALNVTFNPYYDTSHNLYQWICEERIALAVPRPAAVVTVDLTGS
jgi:hypothetical protein